MPTKPLIRAQFKNGSHLHAPRVDMFLNGIRVWSPSICDDQFPRIAEIAGTATSRLRPDGNELISVEFSAEDVSSFNVSSL